MCFPESWAYHTGKQISHLCDIPGSNAQHFDFKKQYIVFRALESESILQDRGHFSPRLILFFPFMPEMAASKLYPRSSIYKTYLLVFKCF
jgi:hypothetical protein